MDAGAVGLQQLALDFLGRFLALGDVELGHALRRERIDLVDLHAELLELWL